MDNNLNYCTNCGNKLIDNPTYCTKCGKRLLSESYSETSDILTSKDTKKNIGNLNIEPITELKSSDILQSKKSKWKFTTTQKVISAILLFTVVLILVYSYKALSSNDSLNSDTSNINDKISLIIADEIKSGKYQHYIVAEELFRQFTINEDEARDKFIGKILLVSGVVKSIKISPNHETEIHLYGDGKKGVIVCRIQQGGTNEIKNISEGKFVNIIGECSDVMDYPILENCLIK